MMSRRIEALIRGDTEEVLNVLSGLTGEGVDMLGFRGVDHTC
jgi:hypothetical protein